MVTRRLLISYLSVLALFLLAASYLYGAQVKADREAARQLQQQLQTLVSELNHRLRRVTADEFKSPAANPLFDLQSRQRIYGWRLVAANDELLAESPPPTDAEFISWQWYFAYPQGTGSRLEVYVPMERPATDSPVVWEALVFFGVGLLLLGVWQFRWLFRLEAYARYIIRGEHRSQLSENAAASGVISQAMNQLILNNTLLEQEKNELSQQIRKVSYIDEVTGLGNQWFFKAEFEVRLHASAEADRGLLMLLSFDQKEAELSDKDWEEIGNVLQSDVQSFQDALVCRLKTTDFAVLLPNESETHIDRFCKGVVNRLRKTVFSRFPSGSNFVAIGISVYHKGFDYYKIMAEADMALRNAQLQGDNAWFIYGEPLAEHLKMGTLRWRTLLQKVISQNKLLLWQQPVVELTAQQSDNILFRQVLARIQIQSQIVGADIFVPMAVRCGMAVDFDKLMFQNLYQLLKNNQSQNDSGESCWSIKLFAESLACSMFRQWLLERLENEPSLAKNIVFSVHENQLNQPESSLTEWMQAVAQTGASWCVEHFGTLEQNLAYLKVCPLGFVKLDRRVVQNISNQISQQLILKSWLVELKHYPVTIIADGIETEADKDYLVKAGIKAGLGFWLKEPSPLIQHTTDAGKKAVS